MTDETKLLTDFNARTPPALDAARVQTATRVRPRGPEVATTETNALDRAIGRLEKALKSGEPLRHDVRRGHYLDILL